jgi:hypothetical protein
MTRRAPLAILAAIALAGCGSSQISSTSATTSTAPRAAPAAAHPACAHLALAYVGTQGATGHLEVTFAARNASTDRCTVHGYPAVRLLDAAGHALPIRRQLGHGFFPDTLKPARTVVLAPGARARFALSFVTNNEYAGARTCRTLHGAQASLPGNGGAWTRLPIATAPKLAPCGTQLVVSPMYAA